MEHHSCFVCNGLLQRATAIIISVQESLTDETLVTLDRNCVFECRADVIYLEHVPRSRGSSWSSTEGSSNFGQH